MKVREAAYLSLERCEKTDKFSNLELDSAIKKYGFKGADRAFFTALVYGVIEKRITLDYVIGKFSSKPIEKIEPKLINILRLGAYQILFLDRTPDSAAVNESVELSKLYTHKGTSSFVNGVLRNLCRSKNDIPMPEKDSDEYYSIKYSCPVWLASMWRESYGKEKAQALLESVNRIPFLTLRVNTLKISRDELIRKLIERGIDCSTSELCKTAVKLNEYLPIADLTELNDGLCFIQDEASQLCTATLGARGGEFVIDTCSCPGGKSFGIGIDMGNKGTLISLDLHESKLSLVENGAKRLGIDILTTAVHNGTKPNLLLKEKADRVLCDVPCSGLGVIAKKPDLRHKSPDDIARLPQIQYNILENASAYLKNGGTLVYSTCTLNKAENEEVVTKFLDAHPEFSPSSDFGMKTLFPDEHNCDGFFIAKLIKQK